MLLLPFAFASLLHLLLSLFSFRFAATSLCVLTGSEKDAQSVFIGMFLSGPYKPLSSSMPSSPRTTASIHSDNQLCKQFSHSFPGWWRCFIPTLFSRKRYVPFSAKTSKQNSPLLFNHIFTPCALIFRPTFPPTHFFPTFYALLTTRGRSEKFGLLQPWGSLRFPSHSRLRLKSTSSARI